jgi:hypothetical protein
VLFLLFLRLRTAAAAAAERGTEAGESAGRPQVSEAGAKPEEALEDIAHNENVTVQPNKCCKISVIIQLLSAKFGDYSEMSAIVQKISRQPVSATVQN